MYGPQFSLEYTLVDGVLGVLRALKYLFRDALARYTDNTEITGSNELPKRFGSTGRLGDTTVTEHVNCIWRNVQKDISGTETSEEQNSENPYH